MLLFVAGVKVNLLEIQNFFLSRSDIPIYSARGFFLTQAIAAEQKEERPHVWMNVYTLGLAISSHDEIRLLFGFKSNSCC
jgi:hypothetical protein